MSNNNSMLCRNPVISITQYLWKRVTSKKYGPIYIVAYYVKNNFTPYRPSLNSGLYLQLEMNWKVTIIGWATW